MKATKKTRNHKCQKRAIINTPRVVTHSYWNRKSCLLSLYLYQCTTTLSNSKKLNPGFWAACWGPSALACAHTRGQDERMPVRLLEVSLALSAGSLLWCVLLSMVNLREVQCQPVFNKNKKARRLSLAKYSQNAWIQGNKLWYRYWWYDYISTHIG